MSIEYKNDELEYTILAYCQDSLVDKPIGRFDYAGNLVLLGTYKTLTWEDLKDLYNKSDALRSESLRLEEDDYDEDDTLFWMDDSGKIVYEKIKEGKEK
jgi:hypothetical protein